jgi:hypothetical protein
MHYLGPSSRLMLASGDMVADQRHLFSQALMLGMF